MIATVSPSPVIDKFSSGPDGIFIWSDPILTTHFLSNWERNPEDFLERIIELLPERYRQVVLDQKKTFIEIISFWREVQTQQRRSCYFDQETWQYSSIKRAYSTHTEGVVELVASLADEYKVPRNNIFIVLIAAFLHDIIEDHPDKVPSMIEMLKRAGVPESKIKSILGLIFRLSKPEQKTIKIIDEYNLHSTRKQGLENESMNIARKIIEDILWKKDKIEEFWREQDRDWYTELRAPRDSKLPTFLTNKRGDLDWVSGLLYSQWFHDSIALDLYRFVQHAFYTQWKYDNTFFKDTTTPSDFQARIQLDLAAILQIVLGTDRNQKSSSKDWFSRAVMLIKLSDQLYNSWDNYYAVDSKTDRISTQYSKKVWQLLHRARMYERVCAMNGAGQNGSIFSLMKVVIDQLQYLLEGSPTSVSAPLVPAIPSAQMTD